MDKKKSLIERAENDAQLTVQFFEYGQRRRVAGLAASRSRVQYGSIFLAGMHHIDDSKLKLCIAIHTYMGLLLKVAGPHFGWDEASQRVQISELGARLLLCADLLDEYLDLHLPREWNDADIYLESGYVTLFRASVAVATEKVRCKQRQYYIDCQKLNKEDVALLNRGLNAALRRIARPQSCALNRRLYVEMKKTERSIDEYIEALQPKLPHAVAVLVTMNVLERGFEYQELERAPSGHFTAQSYVDFFKIAASYIAQLQKVWPDALLGKLAKVTQSKDGHPQCVMLFFLAPSLGTSNWKTRLQAFEVDFNNKRTVKGMNPIGLEVHDVAPASKMQSSSRIQFIKNLINELFVKELRYRRLNLPKRRRSWSRG